MVYGRDHRKKHTPLTCNIPKIPRSKRPAFLASATIASSVSVKYLNNRFCNSTGIPKIRFKNLLILLKSLSSASTPGELSLLIIRPTPTRASAISTKKTYYIDTSKIPDRATIKRINHYITHLGRSCLCNLWVEEQREPYSPLWLALSTREPGGHTCCLC